MQTVHYRAGQWKKRVWARPGENHLTSAYCQDCIVFTVVVFIGLCLNYFIKYSSFYDKYLVTIERSFYKSLWSSNRQNPLAIDTWTKWIPAHKYSQNFMSKTGKQYRQFRIDWFWMTILAIVGIALMFVLLTSYGTVFTWLP